jgi:intein/homing endonuclease
MISKVINSTSFDYGDPAVSLVKFHRQGIDSGSLRKIAGTTGVFHDFLKDFKPPKNQTVVHILAVGDEEKFGPNRNADAFNEADNKKAHPLFKKIGNVFKNHKNTDPKLAVGEVHATAHNDVMSRIELLVGLDHMKCAKEVDAVEKGEDPAFSMGCFTAGHFVTMDNGTTKLLEDVVVGDRVITHLGNRSAVTALSRKLYTGKLFRFDARTLNPIEATGNHPFFVLRREHARKGSTKVYRRKDPAEIDAGAAEWVNANDLRIGDYFVTPAPVDVETDDYVTPALARFLGYYCAEGHLRMTPEGRYCSITLTCNVADQAVKEVPELCRALDIDSTKVHFRPSDVTDKCVSIVIADPWLAYQCHLHCGKLAKTKRLSPELMTWELELQKLFLGAYISGDGCVMRAGSWQPGSLSISTASTALRDQVVSLLNRIGGICGYNVITHRAGVGKSVHATTEYQAYMSPRDARLLVGYTDKLIDHAYKEKGQRGGKRFRVGDCIYTPIDSIVTREVIDAPVFNLEVEPDNSYLISGIAVHNSMQDYDVCSLCKHKAPTAKQHCVHIRTKLGMVTDDGQKIYMQNPDPNFFDISLVYKPADRIAYSLRKVAAENDVIGGHELAAELGWDDMDLEKTAMKRTLASLSKQIPVTVKGVVAPKRVAEKTAGELRKFAAAYGTDQVLGYLSQRDCILHPQDFGALIGMQDTSLCKAAVDSHDGLGIIMGDNVKLGGFDAPAYQERIPFTPDVEGDLQVACSLASTPANHRVVGSMLAPQEKLAAVNGPEHQGFAALYAYYKLAWAQQHADRHGLLQTLAATF